MESPIQGHKDSYSPVTLKCTQKCSLWNALVPSSFFFLFFPSFFFGGGGGGGAWVEGLNSGYYQYQLIGSVKGRGRKGRDRDTQSAEQLPRIVSLFDDRNK